MISFQLFGKSIKISYDYHPLKNSNAIFINIGFLLGSSNHILVFRYDHECLCAKAIHRKFRHSATGIDRNLTSTPLKIGTSLAMGRKIRMIFFGRDERLFTGHNGHLFDRYAQPRIRKLLAIFLSRPSRLSRRRKEWKVQINYGKTDGIFDADGRVIRNIKYETIMYNEQIIVVITIIKYLLHLHCTLKKFHNSSVHKSYKKSYKKERNL